MPELEESLARLKGRWMIGGAAADQAPADWREAASGEAEPDIALLALACQAGQVAFRPRPPQDLAPVRVLPRLALPPLAEALRPSFRRVLDVLKPDGAEIASILHLMASRGASVHPADFMPAAVEDLPACYAPWGGWQERLETPASELTAESWDLWGTAERRLELARIRRAQPEAARALIEAKAGTLPAEQRLAAVGVLRAGLSEADAPYLESLAADRSQKVRALATQLLARLGRVGDETALAAELAGFLHLATGILKAGRLSPAPIKTAAQKARRQELFETVSLNGLAQAMGLPAEELIARWASKASDLRATAGLAAMVAATGSDALAEACLDHLMAEDHDNLDDLAALLERLSAEGRTARLPQILARDKPHLALSRAVMAAQPGRTPYAVLAESGAVARLDEMVAASLEDDAPRRADAALKAGLTALALLADAEAARRLAAHYTGLGLIAADPLLSLLTFNAALGEIPWPNT